MANAIQFRFGPFRLEPAEARVWRNDEEVPLQAMLFKLLCCLVRHAGNLVTTEQLLNEVWTTTHRSNGNLKRHLHDLRRVLGDDPNVPRFIETVPKQGLRFIAPVVTEDIGRRSTGVDGIHLAYQPELAAHWVQRGAMLGKLRAIWEQSLRGSRLIVFLTGDAGIGKTTVIEMFLGEIAGLSPRVLRTRCVQHVGRGEALLPLSEAMEQHCRAEKGGAALVELLRRHAPLWLAQFPSVLTPAVQADLVRKTLSASQERLLREACVVIEELSRDTALVLVVEDLHWSDHATLDFLSLLVRRNGPARLLVLASYRPLDAAYNAHPVNELKRESQRQELSLEIGITPFSRDDVQDFLVRRFPGVAVSEILLEALCKRTGGHPFFLAGLVKHWVDQGQWPPMNANLALDQTVPETIRQVIEREFERLNADEQGLLPSASALAIGEEFSVTLLGAVIGLETVDVDRCCEGLVRRGQILLAAGVEECPDGSVVGRYRFRHALYIEVIYQRLGASEVIRLHRRIGECLEALRGLGMAASAVELARHFECGRSWARVIQYLEEAADSSARRFANLETIGYLDRALALVQHLPKERQPERRIELIKKIVAARRLLGDMTQALAALDEIVAIARSSDNPKAEVYALIESSRVLVSLHRGRCLECAEEAVIRSKAVDDPLLQSIALGNWGGFNILFCKWREDCAQACYEAVEVARRAGGSPLLALQNARLIGVETLASRYREAWTRAKAARKDAETLGDGYMFMMSRYFGALALLHLGEWGRLRTLLGEAILFIKRNGMAAWSFGYRLIQAWLHAEASDFEGARKLCESALTTTSSLHAELNRINASVIFGRAFLGLGDPARAIEHFEALVRAEQNDALPVHRIFFFPAYQGLGEGWLSRGNCVKARNFAERLYDSSVGAPERTYLALSHRLFAEIAMREGNFDEAGSQITQARDIVDRGEVPLAAWRVYTSAAKLCGQFGQSVEARRYRSQSAAVLLNLARSLDEKDPLRGFLSRP